MKKTLLLILLPALAFAENPSSVSTLMSQWLSMESQRGKLESDWDLRKQQLDAKLALFERERQALEEVLAAATHRDDEVDQRRYGLMQEQERLEQEQILATTSIAQAVSRLQLLAAKLPPPLAQQWQGKFDLLFDEQASNSAKLERVLSLCKMAEEFDSRIASHRTTMSLSGQDGAETKVMVTQIYVGLSQGWYVSNDGKFYGYGKSGNAGWQWFHNDAASSELGRDLDPHRILSVRQMLQQPTTATLVSLPIKL